MTLGRTDSFVKCSLVVGCFPWFSSFLGVGVFTGVCDFTGVSGLLADGSGRSTPISSYRPASSMILVLGFFSA